MAQMGVLAIEIKLVINTLLLLASLAIIGIPATASRAERLGLSNAFNSPTLRLQMAESLASIKWQETVETAVTRLEEKTGLALAGLSQLEITLQVREWMKAKSKAQTVSPT